MLHHARIRVDDFKRGKDRFGTFIFFLSHIHEDHLGGLDNNWNEGFIYCSKTTKDLLLKRFPGLNRKVGDKNLVQYLDVGESTLISLGPLYGNTTINVTLLDSNHCLGSVMFLFESPIFGNILHTGDFRYSPLMFNDDDSLNLYDEDKKVEIDYLYLDNTGYSQFSDSYTLDKCMEYLLPALKLYPKHAKFYVGCEKYGKEQLLEQISNALNEKVVVEKDRFLILRQHASTLNINWRRSTYDKCKGRIFAVDRTKVTEEIIRAKNKNEYAVGIKPSSYAKYPKELVTPQHDDARYIPLSLISSADLERLKQNSYNKDGLQRLLYIPYSLHSSHSELRTFVKRLKPCKLYGFVHEKPEFVEFVSMYCNKSPQKLKRLIRLEQNSKTFSRQYGGKITMNAVMKKKIKNSKHCAKSDSPSTMDESKSASMTGKSRKSRIFADVKVTVQENVRANPEANCHIKSPSCKKSKLLSEPHHIIKTKKIASGSSIFESKHQESKDTWTEHHKKLLWTYVSLKDISNDKMAEKIHDLLRQCGKSEKEIRERAARR